MATLALDIGATKIATALLTEDLSPITKFECTISDSPDPWAKYSAQLSEMLATHSATQIDLVGIASAGPINTTAGTISPVNIPSWREFNIVQSLRTLVPAHSFLLQDAVALTIAEHDRGAAQGIENFLGMVVSTGIGGGLFINGQAHYGDTGNAGYFGHHVIEMGASQCACGRSGCTERFASGTSMVRTAHESGWIGVDFQELAQSATAGDKVAIAAIDAGTKALAISFVNLAAILDLNLIVVGGGVSQAGEIYWGPLRRHLDIEKAKVPFLKDLTLKPSLLARDAGLIGAAIAAKSHFDSKLT